MDLVLDTSEELHEISSWLEPALFENTVQERSHLWEMNCGERLPVAHLTFSYLHACVELSILWSSRCWTPKKRKLKKVFVSSRAVEPEPKFQAPAPRI